jgi:6-phosphofructokinase
MAKKAILFALGGHIATQNISFRGLMKRLEPEGYRFYGAKDGFSAFKTGEVYELNFNEMPEFFAGFVAGAGRNSLFDKKGNIDYDKIHMADDFFKRGEFDVAVGSGGDDHGIQMNILNKTLEGKVGVYVINKTMDNDLGGKDGVDGAPYTEFTNGYHSSVSTAVNFLHHHFSGAWTNNLPYLVGLFGRETNWVGIAVSYYGFADRFIYGEFNDSKKEHSIDKIHELILESQNKNEKEFGRGFAMIVLAEGTRISGIKHESDSVDAHGHAKLNPEVLAIRLKEELEKKFKMKTQTAGITYEMRNFPPTTRDSYLADLSSESIADAIRKGNSGVESAFKFDKDRKFIYSTTAPIEKVSRKRYAGYYEKANKRNFIDYENFTVTDEIGEYYKALFGARRRFSDIVPGKLKVVRV